jgi:uncharacterized protein YlxP (DUF503 family)
MSVVVPALRLRYELLIRAMSANDLVKQSGLSAATVSSSLSCKPIAEASLDCIVRVLTATSVNEFIERLLGPFEVWSRGQEPPQPATGPA